MATVIAFFNQVEDYYEARVDQKKFLATYQAFKQVVPSIGQEKQLDREFEQASGYSSYRALKDMKSK